MAHNFMNNIFDSEGNLLFTKCTKCDCRGDDASRPANCPSAPAPATTTPLLTDVTSETDVVSFSKTDPYESLLEAKDTMSTLECFAACITKNSNIWRLESDTYHSPYLALIQGSGSGKTFLVSQTSQKFALIYINLRPRESRALPIRTPLVADSFEILRTESDFIHFYYRIFDTITSWFDNDRFPTLQKFYETVNNKDSGFWGAVESNSTAESKKISVVSIQKLIDNLAKKEPFKDKLFLFAIDEAQSMAELRTGSKPTDSLFYLWRSFISQLKGCRIFFVLMGTTSKLSNFFPQKAVDDSRRIQSGFKLFPPFYHFPFVGPWESIKAQFEISLPVQGLGFIAYNAFLPVAYSRPYFFNYINARLLEGIENILWNECIEFAAKQFEPKSPSTDQTPTFNSVNLATSAMLASKLNLIPLDSTIAESMVASHCATLTLVRPEGSGIEVKYLPEPMLVEGSTIRLSKGNNCLLALKYLQNQLINGKIGAASKKGDLGEFVVAAYLQFIKDKVTAEYLQTSREWNPNLKDVSFMFSLPTPLINFLNSLGYGKRQTVTEEKEEKQQKEERVRKGKEEKEKPEKSVEGNLQAKERLLSSLLSFTSFYKVNGKLSQKLLLNAFIRNCAIFAQENQAAIDLIIPILLLLKRCEGPLRYENLLMLANISVITVQVKHWETKVPKTEKGAKALLNKQCEYVRLNKLIDPEANMVAVLMAVDAGVTDIESIEFEWTTKGDLHITISGLPCNELTPGGSDFSLPAIIIDELRKILSINLNRGTVIQNVMTTGCTEEEFLDSTKYVANTINLQELDYDLPQLLPWTASAKPKLTPEKPLAPLIYQGSSSANYPSSPPKEATSGTRPPTQKRDATKSDLSMERGKAIPTKRQKTTAIASSQQHVEKKR